MFFMPWLKRSVRNFGEEVTKMVEAVASFYHPGSFFGLYRKHLYTEESHPFNHPLNTLPSSQSQNETSKTEAGVRSMAIKSFGGAKNLGQVNKVNIGWVVQRNKLVDDVGRSKSHLVRVQSPVFFWGNQGVTEGRLTMMGCGFGRTVRLDVVPVHTSVRFQALIYIYIYVI